jgi:hypothetical protein
MKNNRLAVVILLLGGLNLGMAQEARLTENVTGLNASLFSRILAPAGNGVWHSLPGKMYFYSWDDSLSWQLMVYSEMSFGTDGLLDTLLNYYDVGGEPISRVVYDYNPGREPVVMTIQNFQSGQWEPVGRYTYLYDESGNLVEQLFSLYLGQTWQPASGSRWHYAYNATDDIEQLVVEKFTSIQGWHNFTRDDYEYAEGATAPSILTHYLWTGEYWTPDHRKDSLEWKVFDHVTGQGMYLRFIEERWDGAWISWYRFNWSYSGEFDYTYIRQAHLGGQWTDDLHYTYRADTAGRILESSTLIWTDGAWAQSEGELHAYATDGIDLLEEIIMRWNPAGGYVNEERLAYEDFIHYLGLVEPETSGGLSVRPNPAGPCFKVMAEQQIHEVVVSDLSGRIIWISKFPGGAGEHEVCPGLIPGIYLVMVWGEDHTVETARVVISR